MIVQDLKNDSEMKEKCHFSFFSQSLFSVSKMKLKAG